MNNERQISEREFSKNESMHLKEFALRLETFIEDFDLTCKYIGRECNLDPRIILRAKKGVRLNGECERRIIYFMDNYDKRKCNGKAGD